MIVKEAGWDANKYIEGIKEFFAQDLFDQRVAPTIFLGRKEGIPVARLKSDIERIVHTWMKGIKDLDETSRYFYGDCDVRSTYIFTIDFLETGGTLISLIVKFRGVVDPVRLDVIY